MTIKNNKMTSETYNPNTSVAMILAMTIVITSIVISPDLGVKFAFAGHPNCAATPNSSHCYATSSINQQNSGNKANMLSTDLTTGGTCNTSSSSTDYHTNISHWLQLNANDWIEAGFITGYQGTICEPNDITFGFKSFMGVGTWIPTTMTTTHGSTYTFQADDITTDKTWIATRGGVEITRISNSGDPDGWGSVGPEITHNSAAVPKTKISNIQYYSTSNLWKLWDTGVTVNQLTIHSPLNRNICTPNYDANYGTTTLTCP